MKSFRVSPTVTFPANAATSTFAFLGTRGSGKTYGAGVLVEQFLAVGVQTVIVDPVGTWWGLRLAADGKSPGFNIPVFGGVHGDVPLSHVAGALVAQLIVERRLSVVLDVSDFTGGQQQRFVTDLAQEIFQLKKRNPSPLHLLFEEGHEFFPQFVDGAAAPLVGATKRLWKVGRNYGIGGTIVSQRAAEVNKGALWLTDRIITGRLTASDDMKRIDGWANSNGVSDSMVAELPKLPKGTLIVWEETGAVQTVFQAKTTFDASKTPDGTSVKAAKLSPIDLDAVRTAMAATIEEAKANDPKALRARIAELERTLAATPTPASAPIKTVEKRIIKEADLKRIERVTGKLGDAEIKFSKTVAEAVNVLAQRQQVVTTELGNLRTALSRTNHPVALPARHFQRNNTSVGGADPRRHAEGVPIPHLTTNGVPRADGTHTGITKYARELLNVVASRGVASDSQISALSGYRITSSGFGKAIAQLTSAGLIQGTPKSRTLTETGKIEAGAVTELPTGRALLNHWIQRLTGYEAAVLNVVHRHGTTTRDQISQETGYRQTSSGFGKAIGALKMLELIHGDDGGDLTIADSFR